jgi:hypothetical protein
MRIIKANRLPGFVQKSAKSASDFAAVVRNLMLDVRDGYRPEVPDLRGPGAKWHAKHLPWLRFDSEAVPPGGPIALLPVHVRLRDSDKLAR